MGLCTVWMIHLNLNSWYHFCLVVRQANSCLFMYHVSTLIHICLLIRSLVVAFHQFWVLLSHSYMVCSSSPIVVRLSCFPKIWHEPVNLSDVQAGTTLLVHVTLTFDIGKWNIRGALSKDSYWLDRYQPGFQPLVFHVKGSALTTTIYIPHTYTYTKSINLEILHL